MSRLAMSIGSTLMWPRFNGGNLSVGSIYDAARNMQGQTTSRNFGGSLTVNNQALGNYEYKVALGDQILSSFTASHWFSNTADSLSSFIVVQGSLQINSGITFTPPVRKLFTVVYVTKDLIVNGQISMTRRGANHSSTGSNITSRAIRIANGTYSGVSNPIVPASGGSGGNSVSGSSSSGQVGTNGSNGGSGGGGSGASAHGSGGSATSGAGAAGTAFSGGSGGGGRRSNFSSSGSAQAGAANGGKGGNGSGGGSNASPATDGAGGAGNPGGTSTQHQSSTTHGQAGTGGTLIVIAEGIYSGNGQVTAHGAAGGDASRGTDGGGSGAGSITILCGTNNSGPSSSATGGSGNNNGGRGGHGSTRILFL